MELHQTPRQPVFQLDSAAKGRFFLILMATLGGAAAF